MEDRCGAKVLLMTMELMQAGDVVRLAGSVTRAEFGLALCDDDGEALEIDGRVIAANERTVNVMIRRMLPCRYPLKDMEGTVMRWVKRNEVLGVIDGEARLWPDAASLRSVSDEREGRVRKASQPVFWTVGMEEIPAG